MGGVPADADIPSGSLAKGEEAFVVWAIQVFFDREGNCRVG